MDSSNNNLGYFPQMPVCDKHLSVELNSDFSLPDYQPEIRRLLCTHCSLSSPNEYIGNANAELDGDISYRIIYLGADGKLYCAKLSDRYSFSAPLDFSSKSVNTDEVTLVPSCSAESVNTRVLGPRKLNVRAKLSCRALALSPALYSPSVSGTYNPANIEELIFEAAAANIKRCSGEMQILNDLIPLDPQMDNVRIIDSESAVIINESVPVNDKINVRGEVVLKILYCNDAQSDLPLTMTRKIPFSDSVFCEGVDNSFDCSAWGYANEEKFEVSDNGINIETVLTLCCRAQKNENISYINDSYSTERACECKNEEIKVLSALKCSNGNLTQNEVFRLDDIKLSRDAKIVYSHVKTTLNNLVADNGKLVLLGNCEYQIIYYFDGEYSSLQLNSPLRYELDLRAVSVPDDSLKWYADVSASSVRSRCDEERLFVDSELNFNILIQSENTVDILSEISMGESLERCEGELIICYPEKGENLWNVAKQYGRSVRKIKLKNSIPDNESAVNKKYLII